MKLHYVSIGLSDDYCIDKEYRKTFEYHTRFISNYLSRKIRKYKYETDGTYNMIYICLGCVRQPCIDNNSLVIHLPFDKEKYETARQLEDFEYYLTFFEEGFKEATELKNIPKQILFQMLDDFRTDRYKNEWVYKKKKIHELDLSITMTCQFTTNSFSLIVNFESISSKKKLCSSVAMRTMPDELHFDYLFRDIVLREDKLCIIDFVGDYYVYYRIDDIIKGDDHVNYRTKENIDDDQFYDMVIRNIKFCGKEFF